MKIIYYFAQQEALCSFITQKELNLAFNRLTQMKTLLTILIAFSFFHINAQVTAQAGPDQSICLMDTLKVFGTGLNKGDTGSYQWKDIGNNMVYFNTSYLAIKLTNTSSRSFELKVTKVSNGNTYYAYDTLKVIVNALPSFAFKGIPPRCYLDGPLNLTANQIVTAYQGNKSSSTGNIRYFQRFKNPSWISGGPVGVNDYIYDYPKYISNGQVPKTGFRDSVCYEFTDSQGCYNSECKPFRMNPNPVVDINDGVFCQQAGVITLDKLVSKPFSKVGGVQSFRILKVPTGSGVDPNAILSTAPTSPPTTVMYPGNPGENEKTGDYVVEYCFKDAITGCQTCDTSTVNVIRLPEIKFSSITQECVNNPLLALDSFATDKYSGKRFTHGTWSTVEYGGSRDMSNSSVRDKILNSVKFQKYFDPSLGAGQYLLRLKDSSSGCPISDSVYIKVNGLPLIKINVLDSVCANDSAFMLENMQPSGNVGSWSGKGVNGRKFDPSSFTSGLLLNTSKVIYTYTHPLTLCTSSDSQYVLVQNAPKFKAIATAQSGQRYRVNFSLSNISYMDTSKATFDWDFGSSGNSSYAHPSNIFYADSGRHTAYVRVSFGLCDTYDSIIFDLNYKTVSIEDITYLIAIYPNPAHDQLTVQMPLDAAISLYVLNGKMISAQIGKADIPSVFYISELHKGIYLVSIQTDKQVIWKKVMIE